MLSREEFMKISSGGVSVPVKRKKLDLARIASNASRRKPTIMCGVPEEKTEEQEKPDASKQETTVKANEEEEQSSERTADTATKLKRKSARLSKSVTSFSSRPNTNVEANVPPLSDVEEGKGDSTLNDKLRNFKRNYMPYDLSHPSTSNASHAFKCDMCSYSGRSAERITAHKEHVHHHIVCRFCSAKFNTLFARQKHLSSCEVVMAVKNRVQERYSNNAGEEEVIRHLNVPTVCPLCEKTFNTMFEMSDHKVAHTSNITYDYFLCTGCNMTFRTATALQAHLLLQYRAGNGRCYGTGAAFALPRKPAAPTTRTYAPEPPPRLTEVAGDNFTRGSRDILAYTPVQPAALRQDLTPVEYDETTKTALVSAHLLTESDGKSNAHYFEAMRTMLSTVYCPFCEARCRTYGALHNHTLYVHSGTGRCLYQCGGCKITFATPTALGQHLRKEFDAGNKICFNTGRAIRKSDFNGLITSWRKKIPANSPAKKRKDGESSKEAASFDPSELTAFSIIEDIVAKPPCAATAEEEDVKPDVGELRKTFDAPATVSFRRTEKEIKEEPV